MATTEYYEKRANSDDLIIDIDAKPFCYGEVIEDADPVIFKRENDLSLDENFKGNSKKYTYYL